MRAAAVRCNPRRRSTDWHQAGGSVSIGLAAADGGVNSCKGHGECKTAKNECKGLNGCKGQGWSKAKTAKACTDAGGTVAK